MKTQFAFLFLFLSIASHPSFAAESDLPDAAIDESDDDTTVAPAEKKPAEKIPLPQSQVAQETYPDANLPQMDDSRLWFRNVGEYIANRTVRSGLANDTNTKMNTNGTRFDVSLGKRIALLKWHEHSNLAGWAAGVDAGMLASLDRFQRAGKLTFATNTFDGSFGAWVGYSDKDGWIALFRTAHLSAHLVDNNPQVTAASSYSQFWNEIIVSKSFPGPTETSEWDLQLQASVGLNNTSFPSSEQPRATGGVSYGHAFDGPDSIAWLLSADVLRPGVKGQLPTYAYFAGIGSLNRPNTTTRPFRIGVAHYTGSDYRNQYFYKTQKFTVFQVALDL